MQEATPATATREQGKEENRASQRDVLEGYRDVELTAGVVFLSRPVGRDDEGGGGGRRNKWDLATGVQKEGGRGREIPWCLRSFGERGEVYAIFYYVHIAPFGVFFGIFFFL